MVTNRINHIIKKIKKKKSVKYSNGQNELLRKYISKVDFSAL